MIANVQMMDGLARILARRVVPSWARTPAHRLMLLLAPLLVAGATAHASTQPPTAPTGLVATATAPDTIYLTWFGSTADETGFTVERGQVSDFATIQATWNLASNVTVLSDTGLSQFATYYYRVRASNDAGASPNSDSASATTPSSQEIVLTNTVTATPVTFTVGSNWDPRRIPGAFDTAVFTNNKVQSILCTSAVVTAKAVFRQTDISQICTLTGTAARAWTLTNSLVIGESAGQAAAVVVSNSGMLAVTNASHTAQLVVGPAGAGKLTFSGGTVLVDRLIATNNSAAATNSLLAFSGGTLITSNAASVLAATFTVPSNSTFGINNTWNLLGGSNRIASADANGNTATFRIGDSVNACTMRVTRAMLNVGGNVMYVGYNSINNALWIDGVGVAGGGVVTNIGALTVGYRFGGSGSPSGNNLVVTNGGQLWGKGSSTVGYSAQNGVLAVNNRAVVTGASSLWNVGGNSVTIGGNNLSSRTARTNTVTVTSGGTLTNVSLLLIGSSGGDIVAGNQLVVTNGGQIFASGVQVGNNVGLAFDNSVLITDGGLLEANSLTNYPGSTNNTIRNVRGVYQFTTATPKLVPNGTNLTLADGTIAFRAVTNADVFANVGGVLSNITFSGTNAFRLNGASNTIASAQGYVFDPAFGPTNYARLEMINGATCYRGQAANSLTIGQSVGSGGQMLCSNTAATVALPFTNNGTLTLVNSTLTCTNNAVFNGTLVVDLDRLATTGGLVVAQRALTLGPGSTLVCTGMPSTVVLMSAAAGYTGGFATVAGVPSAYCVSYTPTTVLLRVKPQTTAILFQ